MPEAGFEPTITASARAKTVHALDRAATVTGYMLLLHVHKYINRMELDKLEIFEKDTTLVSF
jgi:hypothetical protein